MQQAEPVPEQKPADRRRWLVLAAGMTGLVAACAFQYGLPFLVPAFRAGGLTLAQAGWLVSAPVFGVLCSLVLWGMVTDRLGERWVLTAGLVGAAVALLAASAAHRPAVIGGLLFVAGACAACVQVASGRLILGWFPVHERGLAMGSRQTGQPLGVGVAALVLPGLGSGGTAGALLFLSGCCVLAALLIAAGVRDAHREPAPVIRAASPYRAGHRGEQQAGHQGGRRGGHLCGYLPRVHLASALLVVPQFTVAAFAFDYLVNDRHWSTSAAGPLLAGAAAGGAAIRLAAGWWSDRAGRRLAPMRTLCLATGGVLALLAVTAAGGDGVAVVAVLLAAVLTVSTNGLAFTAVAERAGQAWAGRALGVQNTGQNLLAAATPPVLAVVITGIGPVSGYPAAFAAVVVLPLVAAVVLPVAAEKS